MTGKTVKTLVKGQLSNACSSVELPSSGTSPEYFPYPKCEALRRPYVLVQVRRVTEFILWQVDKLELVFVQVRAIYHIKVVHIVIINDRH